jgi:hypothetical protein
MSIDAVISAVRREQDKTWLLLSPRQEEDGTFSLAGRRQLYITNNPNHQPQTGEQIWGNAHEVMIGEHRYQRIMRLWDGTYVVLP